MQLEIGGEEAADTAARYAKIELSVFAQGPLLLLMGLFYSSPSYYIGAGNDKDAVNLGEA